jgi:hypothetical protein
MPVRFLRNASELADVSWESPLPVQVANAKPVPADTLLVAITTVTTTTNRDLMENTNTETPTLDNCGQYRKLVWFYFRAGGAAPPTASSHARPTCPHNRSAQAGKNSPQARSQATQTAGDRIEIPSTGDGYYDQYRIEVYRTDGATTHSQVNLSECADDPHHWRLAT